MAPMKETLFWFLYYPVSIQMILTLGSADKLLNCDIKVYCMVMNVFRALQSPCVHETVTKIALGVEILAVLGICGKVAVFASSTRFSRCSLSQWMK